MKRRSISIALLLLVIAALACNAPETQEGIASPTPSPFTPPDEETPGEEPTGPTEEPSPTPTETVIPTPTSTITPTTTPSPAPTATPEPVSTGPLDFVPPSWPESYQARPDGGMDVTLRIEISGGAPPFTIYHDETLMAETHDRNPSIVIEHGGCSAIVHTITVESADGQRVSDDYWIQPPWCITPES